MLHLDCDIRYNNTPRIFKFRIKFRNTETHDMKLKASGVPCLRKGSVENRLLQDVSIQVAAHKLSSGSPLQSLGLQSTPLMNDLTANLENCHYKQGSWKTGLIISRCRGISSPPVSFSGQRLRLNDSTTKRLPNTSIYN